MPADRLLQTLLAEGYSTLLELVPEGARSNLYEIERLECDAAEESERRAAWRAELRKWRDDAEELCDGRWADAAVCGVARQARAEECGDGRVDSASWSPEALDREIRRLCAELAQRDLALGILAESARKAAVWRRLGFASEAQYARERVGVSLSSLKTKTSVPTHHSISRCIGAMCFGVRVPCARAGT